MCNRCEKPTPDLKTLGYRVEMKDDSFKVFYGKREIASNKNYLPNSAIEAKERAWGHALSHFNSLADQLALDQYAMGLASTNRRNT